MSIGRKMTWDELAEENARLKTAMNRMQGRVHNLCAADVSVHNSRGELGAVQESANELRELLGWRRINGNLYPPDHEPNEATLDTLFKDAPGG